MLSFDSKKKSKQRVSKGRLARSLKFTPKPTTKSYSIWRDPLKSIIQPAGFIVHKMSSVTNNFGSSELAGEEESSEIDGIVGELDPGKGTLVFPQHDEVFRTSPLSSSSFIAADSVDEMNDFPMEDEDGRFNNFESNEANNSNSLGMSWNPKRDRWIPLVYRYIFPSSAFSVPKQVELTENPQQRLNTTWTLKNGHVHFNNNQENNELGPTFKFPPSLKSIMMGHDTVDSDARDVCEKLLELMDDENLMLPVVKMSSSSTSTLTFQSHCKNNHNNHNKPRENQNQNQSAPSTTAGRALLSEWSSLPSSPPPPIFHDFCNRPIPELRLSPPMSGKSIGKRLFSNSINNTTTNTTGTNSPCESPLTKRLRFSSSSSSIS